MYSFVRKKLRCRQLYDDCDYNDNDSQTLQIICSIEYLRLIYTKILD